ncbi:MAG: bifunctional diguanylate cyclase/phosphodiesterase, partial [Fibrobacter sp.]|nr:bifunctional diguanylate cyclase/phosphodiesterase [Fibrobacter sp.]
RTEKKMREDVKITPPPPTQAIQATRDLKKDLDEKEELFKMMLSVSSSGFFSFDVCTGKVDWSQKALKILQVETQKKFDSFEVLQTHILESDWNRFKQTLNTSLENGVDFTEYVTLLKRTQKDNQLKITGSVQTNADGRPIRIICAINECADNLTNERKQNFYNYQDALTGVYNRKCFLEKLKRDFEIASERPDYIFAVALLDIDSFGAINTSYSINVGDNVLRVVADRVRSQSRTSDTIARIGPDVFAIILHDIQGSDSDVLPLVRRIHNAAKMPIQLEGRELYISVSMAVALNRDVDTLEDIMANATESLREMKKGINHGGIQFFSGGIREKAMKLYRLEFEIRRAIQAQEFVLMYQPIVDVSGDEIRVASFEALVRWKQSEKGYISPADFIPIAEETGLIIPMGALILRMACEQAKKWVEMGYENIQIAVNFSAKQFAMDSMVEDVKKVLLETKLNPKNLKLEITEYTAICEADKTIAIMNALSSMGLQISIDDFGTGYSSLSYLKQFPIHTLKMDKSFVDHVADDEEDAAFARMVVSIAKSLNLDLIAEGVENEDQLDFLKSEGCHLIQGYYFSRPLEPETALAYLQKHYGVPNTSVKSDPDSCCMPRISVSA